MTNELKCSNLQVYNLWPDSITFFFSPKILQRITFRSNQKETCEILLLIIYKKIKNNQIWYCELNECAFPKQDEF